MDLDASAQAAIQAAVLKTLWSRGRRRRLLQTEPRGGIRRDLPRSRTLLAREAISLMLAKCDLDSWGFEMALPVWSIVEETLVEDFVRFDTR